MTEANKDIPRILIVDDVEANRFILSDIIADMGYQPMLAENGMQALKIIQRRKPQLIISDISMPEMDGYELCQQLKADSDMKVIPMIFISAYDEPEDVVKGFSVGGADYITKPFMPEVVKARVNVHLKLYETNRNMTEMNRQLQLSNREQLRQMEAARRSILYVLIRVARENACYDKLFMERLSYNCRILAEAMQLSEHFGHLISDSFVDTIELAAPLCDLGNMAIPTGILQKQGSLDEEEKAIMQTHTTIGAKILKDVSEVGVDNSFIRMAEEIAHYHHENWDGTGYPEKKKGDEIPLSAQIVAVAKSFCALTEDRTYRNAFDREVTFEIMEQESNQKFNPEIFEILKKIARQMH